MVASRHSCALWNGIFLRGDKKVGFDAVAQQQIEKMPAQAAQIDAMAPEDKARRIHQRAVGTKYTTYAFAVPVLIFVFIHALLLWACF